MHVVLAGVLVSTLLVGQQDAAAGAPAAKKRVTAAIFLPADYENVAAVDFKALRDTGVWDSIATGILQPVLAKFEAENGFSFAAVDRLTGCAIPPANGEAHMAQQEIYVYEGNQPLALPPTVASSDASARSTVGGVEVVEKHMGMCELHALPRPDCYVTGTRGLVVEGLENSARRGGPAPDVMSLLSGRGDNLGWFVLSLNSSIGTLLRSRLMIGADWPEGDEPSWIMGRLRAIGDHDDPHVGVEIVLRHPKVGAGIEQSKAAAAAFLQRCGEDKKLAALRPVLAAVQTTVVGSDLVLSADLGRARNAAGTMAAIAAAIVPEPR